MKDEEIIMTDLDPTQVVLSAINSLRVEFADFRKEISQARENEAKKVAVLQNQMTTIIGNGHDGRLTLVEKAVDGLKSKLVWGIGICTGFSAFAAFVGWVYRFLPPGLFKS